MLTKKRESGMGSDLTTNLQLAILEKLTEQTKTG